MCSLSFHSIIHPPTHPLFFFHLPSLISLTSIVSFLTKHSHEQGWENMWPCPALLPSLYPVVSYLVYPSYLLSLSIRRWTGTNRSEINKWRESRFFLLFKFISQTPPQPPICALHLGTQKTGTGGRDGNVSSFLFFVVVVIIYIYIYFCSVCLSCVRWPFDLSALLTICIRRSVFFFLLFVVCMLCLYMFCVRVQLRCVVLRPSLAFALDVVVV